MLKENNKCHDRGERAAAPQFDRLVEEFDRQGEY
jgi:hypothetical protein